jgi:osmotically-inducible protein OsmY
MRTSLQRRRELIMKRADSDIRRDVEAELQWDPSIDDLKIGVMVADGVVTLSGEVTHLTGRPVP